MSSGRAFDDQLEVLLHDPETERLDEGAIGQDEPEIAVLQPELVRGEGLTVSAIKRAVASTLSRIWAKKVFVPRKEAIYLLSLGSAIVDSTAH